MIFIYIVELKHIFLVLEEDFQIFMNRCLKSQDDRLDVRQRRGPMLIGNMMAPNNATMLLRQAVTAEIAELIARAKSKDVIHAGDEAIRIFAAFPENGMTEEEVREEIIRAAVLAHLAVDTGRPLRPRKN
jgi:hypothetical protein